MAKRRMAGVERLGKVVMEGQADELREMVRGVVHEVMAEEVEAVVGAGRYERREGRVGWRNGTRSRQWDTRVGTIDLAVPRVPGEVGYFPSFLEYRRIGTTSITIDETTCDGGSPRPAEGNAQCDGCGTHSVAGRHDGWMVIPGTHAIVSGLRGDSLPESNMPDASLTPA